MTKTKRIKNIFMALISALSGWLIIKFPEYGLILVLIILGLGLVIKGIQIIYYYFTMARFSVGGKIVLYMGIIILDLGVLSLNLTDIPELYIMLYLIICYMFSGVIDVVRSLEAKRLESSWRLNMCTGIINIVIAIMCILSMRSVGLLTTIYGCGLIYSALTKIIQSFRKTAIVYIQ